MNLKEVNLNIKGMHCASCAQTIEKTLNKQKGITKCNVNYGTEKAFIEYETDKISLEEVNEKINPFGYSLDIPIPESNTEHIMPNGEIMNSNDHSAHLGINQTKKDKLKELAEMKKGLITSLPMVLISFFVMLWEILGTYKIMPEMSYTTKEFFHHILPLFATYILFVTGIPYIKGIIRFIKYKVANMDTLVGIGTLTAYLYSVAISSLEEPLKNLINVEHTYYDVTIIVIGFITLGKYLETKSKIKTGEAIEKLLNLQAKTALVEREGQRIEIPIEQVKIGEIIIVKPGTKIPVDGEIIEGYSSVDESMITGESIPVDKKYGNLVIGGTLNKQGSFKFKATKIGSDTMIAQIIKMVENAQGSKAPIQNMADKISSIFVPTVLIIAIISLISWLIIGPYFIPTTQAISLGILSFVGILVIACPCALGLATPTAIIVGTGKGAEAGILIKNAEGLEKLSKADTIVLDKTGTITKGEPEITDVIILNNSSRAEIMEILGSLEHNSEHPLAEAIKKEIIKINTKIKEIENFEIIEGKGLFGTIDNKKYYAGNTKLLEDLNIENPTDKSNILTMQGKTPIFLATNDQLLAIIGVADTLKENTKDTINKLHKLGLKVILLTGDNVSTAKFIAEEAGIDEVIAEVLPNQKAEKIKELQKENKIVAMIGDGINDAPALSQADIGIAMATGTDIAIESAQITLLKGDISKILKAIKLSKYTFNTIKQNLFWAFIYNILGIPLAAGVLYPVFGILLNPVLAGLAMSFSSVSVVSNSLRLKFKSI